ncbi:MAG TPA: signal peptidase I [Candidatus Limnocylindria bacterium]
MRSHLREVFEILQVIVLAAVISVLLNAFVIQVTEVLQISMQSTLHQGDRVLVSKLDYRFGRPSRCDIIVFHPPIEGVTIAYVKRVIAISGDRVELRDGGVYVNGAPSACTEGPHGTTLPEPGDIHFPLTVPEGAVFALGDNREESTDSRAFGHVTDDRIIGKVILRFWPLTNARFFSW